MKMKSTWIALATMAAATFAASAQEGERPQRGPRQMPAEVVKEFDKDGDGKLSDEEAKAAREALQSRREEARKKMLEKYDKDGDGQLNEEERAKMREDLEARHKALLEKYDANKNGRLDPDERKAAVDAGEELPMARPMGGQRGPRGEGARGERGQRGEGGQRGERRPRPQQGE